MGGGMHHDISVWCKGAGLHLQEGMWEIQATCVMNLYSNEQRENG